MAIEKRKFRSKSKYYGLKMFESVTYQKTHVVHIKIHKNILFVDQKNFSILWKIKSKTTTTTNIQNKLFITNMLNREVIKERKCNTLSTIEKLDYQKKKKKTIEKLL